MKNIYKMSAWLLLLTGCSDSTVFEELTNHDTEINFYAIYPGASRATTTGFEEGDCMGIFITQYEGATATPLQVTGNFANNVSSTLTAGKWINAPKVYWEDGIYDIYSYYPYTKINSVDNFSFTVCTDQSTPHSADALGGYEASDLLWACSKGIERTESVDLTFKHTLSCVQINLVKSPDYTGELPSEAEVYVHNTYNGALIDLASGIVEKDGYSDKHSIKAKKTGSYSYEAIVVPQRVESRVPLFEVVANGVSFLSEDRFNFAPGKKHCVNIVLSNNPTAIKIEIGGEISGWN